MAAVVAVKWFVLPDWKFNKTFTLIRGTWRAAPKRVAKVKYAKRRRQLQKKKEDETHKFDKKPKRAILYTTHTDTHTRTCCDCMCVCVWQACKWCRLWRSAKCLWLLPVALRCQLIYFARVCQSAEMCVCVCLLLFSLVAFDTMAKCFEPQFEPNLILTLFACCH